MELLSRQVTLAVMVCGWAHVLHGVYQPWGAGSPTYFVQHLSLFLTTFVFLMGLLFKVRLPCDALASLVAFPCCGWALAVHLAVLSEAFLA